MKTQHGFSLIELMIVLAIIGILAAIAVPNYNEYVTKSKLAEAIGPLSDMRVKMERHFQDNRTYVGACAAGTTAPLPTGTRYFAFTCPTLTATTFTVTATGIAGQGMGGFAYSVDQANLQSTAIGAPASTDGWVTSANCWVTRKGAAPGSCS